MEKTETIHNKIDQIEAAIQQLFQSKQTSSEEDRRLLDKLLSQLESLKGDGTVKPFEESVQLDEAKKKIMDETEVSGNDVGDAEEEEEDVVKELKKLKRQNRTTNWLLSALLFVTVAWQISEVMFLFKMKESLSHPLKSLGNVVTGIFKHPEPDDNESSENKDE